MTTIETKIVDIDFKIRSAPYQDVELSWRGQTVKVPTAYLVQLIKYLEARQTVSDFQIQFGVKEYKN
jgi:hypothetical protein